MYLFTCEYCGAVRESVTRTRVCCGNMMRRVPNVEEIQESITSKITEPVSAEWDAEEETDG